MKEEEEDRMVAEALKDFLSDVEAMDNPDDSRLMAKMLNAATVNGVSLHRSLVSVLIAAPRFNKSDSTVACRFQAAQCSDVLPSLSSASMFAP